MASKANKTSKILFGSSSNNIAKFFNGRALCDTTISALFDQYISEDNKIHCVYKVIDRTNGFEYWGKINTASFSKFRKYVGSGTLLRYMVAQKGIHNFEQHFMSFYETRDETEIAERQIVDETYLKMADTYNMAVGGTNHFKEPKKMFHCKNTGKTFKCNHNALERILSTFDNFAKGISAQDILNSHWMNGTLKNVVEKQKFTTVWKDTLGQYEELQVPTSNLIQYLNKGYEIKSTKLWIHIPNQSIYRRGQNWKQIQSNTENVMHYIQQGFIAGRPPRMEGAIIDSNWKANKMKTNKRNKKPLQTQTA
jgi:hypothetical protein